MELPKEMKKPAKKCKVAVITTLEGELQFELNGRFLKYKIYEESPCVDQELEVFEISKAKKQPYKPPRNHPWRSFKFGAKKVASIAVTFLSIFS